MCIYVQCVQKPTKSANRKQESDGSKNASLNMAYLNETCDQISDSCHQQLLRKMCIYKCMFNVYKNQQNRQTGSRNLMGPKTLPTIWGTYMKLVTKYQISAINSCREKWDNMKQPAAILVLQYWYTILVIPVSAILVQILVNTSIPVSSRIFQYLQYQKILVIAKI